APSPGPPPRPWSPRPERRSPSWRRPSAPPQKSRRHPAAATLGRVRTASPRHTSASGAVSSPAPICPDMGRRLRPCPAGVSHPGYCNGPLERSTRARIGREQLPLVTCPQRLLQVTTVHTFPAGRSDELRRKPAPDPPDPP